MSRDRRLTCSVSTPRSPAIGSNTSMKFFDRLRRKWEKQSDPEAGMERIILVSGVEEAFALKSRSPSALLMSEV
jgi:hypothetical protein